MRCVFVEAPIPIPSLYLASCFTPWALLLYPCVTPANNPFMKTRNAVGSVWGLGLRNPYTFAFEANVPQAVPRMFINDVGWDSAEEINAGAPGANYGWPNSEVGCLGVGMAY